ncbi:hypothetical protein SARC_00340, partial [Sphaeroforma arctica JP610]
ATKKRAKSLSLPDIPELTEKQQKESGCYTDAVNIQYERDFINEHTRNKAHAHARVVKERMYSMALERDEESQVDGASVLMMLVEDIVPELLSWINASIRVERQNNNSDNLRLVDVEDCRS